MRDSLRARLTLWNLLIVASALSLFAVLLYSSFARRVYSHHDEELADDAARLLAVVGGASDPRAVTNGFRRIDAGQMLAMLRDRQGRLLFRSSRLTEFEPGIGEHQAFVHAAARAPAKPQFFTVQLQKAGTVRFICLPASKEGNTFLQLGQPLGDVNQTLGFLRQATVVLIPLVMVLTSFGGLIIARRALAPVDAIAKTLEEIQATDLDRRIEPVPHDEELRRMVVSLNRLLDRLARAFASLREFAADASHQLQTPLTVMKGSLDVALSSRPDPAAYRTVLTQISEEIDVLTAVLSDLRALSLADAGYRADTAKCVDASRVFQEAAEIVQALGEAADVAVDVSIAPALTVWGDEVRLQQIVLNLGDNAVKYSPRRGTIRIAASARGDHVQLVVADTGTGIAPEDLPHIFDRFYRGRGADVAGSGLGLAIVKRIVNAHGGRVEAANNQQGGATFTVYLPLARPA